MTSCVQSWFHRKCRTGDEGARCLETSGAHAQVVESTIGSIATAKSRSKFKELISSFFSFVICATQLLVKSS